MGRGRAKAKQQKVARDLKYNAQPTDLDALQRELGHTTNGTSVFTDDPDRTIATYAERGLEVRRVRELSNGTTQTFLRAGEVIIELVGPIAGDGERLWGLSPTVADLDACARLLGDRLGRIKDATQPGRRIATLRHEACGLTIPIAFMSPDPR